MKTVSVLTKEKGTNVDAGNIVAKKAVAKSVATEKEVMKQERLDIAEASNAQEKVEMKSESEKKAVVKKVAEKKETVKSAKTVEEEVFVQYANQEASATSVIEKVKAAYIAEGHDAESIEKIRVYVKPAENMIYYVVNDDYASGISLF